MKKTELDQRFTVVKRLQERLASLEPGSSKYELYDKAYSLALNTKRNVGPYFLRNLLRDARRILERSFTPQFISLNQDIPVKVQKLIYDKTITSNFGETNLDYTTLRNTITFICQYAHPYAEEVLVCMLDGYNINETADRTKLSASMVKKLRSKITKEVKLKFEN
jgi:hypothetical protein